MTVRNDITINWTVSPRIITIAAPSVEVTIQDLYDTCMTLEALPSAMDDDHIIDAAGKEQLGGGTTVGLTATLLNALVAFQDRAGPTYTQCSVSGGNLVALQDDLTTYFATPISPTAFTQVVTTASSSATTQSQEQMEHGTFDGGVTINALNGFAGTAYPVGTSGRPVNNILDAQTIATERGFSKLFVRGNLTLDSDAYLVNFLVVGQNAQITQITVDAAAVVSNTEFQECRLTGDLDGGSVLRSGVAANLNFINGFLFEVMLEGTLTLGGNTPAYMFNCFSGTPGQGTPAIDMAGAGQALALRGYNGGIKLINKTGADEVSLDFVSGQAIIDSTVTNGDIVIRGVAKVTDNSTGTANIMDETVGTGTADVNVDDFFNAVISGYVTPDSFGQWLNEKGLTKQGYAGLKSL